MNIAVLSGLRLSAFACLLFAAACGGKVEGPDGGGDAPVAEVFDAGAPPRCFDENNEESRCPQWIIDCWHLEEANDADGITPEECAQVLEEQEAEPMRSR